MKALVDASRNSVAAGWNRDVRQIDRFGVAPEALELVISTGGFGKDMHEEIAVIHQNPFGCIVPFDADRNFAGLLQLLFDFVADGMPLARIGRRADDKEIGERGNFANVENPQIGGFFRFGGPDCDCPARWRAICGAMRLRKTACQTCERFSYA